MGTDLEYIVLCECLCRFLWAISACLLLSGFLLLIILTNSFPDEIVLQMYSMYFRFVLMTFLLNLGNKFQNYSLWVKNCKREWMARGQRFSIGPVNPCLLDVSSSILSNISCEGNSLEWKWHIIHYYSPF